MDPTMQSHRLLPSGPHYYPVRSWIGSIKLKGDIVDFLATLAGVNR